MTDAKLSFRDRQNKLRSALSALAAEAGGQTRRSSDERLQGYIEALTTGQEMHRGKLRTLNISATAKLVLKVCGLAGWQAVPSVVASRFAWDKAGHETLKELALADKVGPNELTAALGLGALFPEYLTPPGLVVAPSAANNAVPVEQGTEPPVEPQNEQGEPVASEPAVAPEPAPAPEPAVAPVRRSRTR